jgi:DNA-binding response OmpR family regulator
MNYPQPKRILLLDKDLDVRSKVSRFLMGEGYEVELAANVSDALALHRNNPFDVVLVELLLASTAGFKLFFQMQSSAVPPQIIVLARQRSVRTSIYLEIAHRLGADASLTRPFTAAQLRATVCNVLIAAKQSPPLYFRLVESPVG